MRRTLESADARLDAAILDADRAHDLAGSLVRRLGARGTPNSELVQALADLDEQRAAASEAQALEAATQRVKRVMEGGISPAGRTTDTKDSAPEVPATPDPRIVSCGAQAVAAPPAAESMGPRGSSSTPRAPETLECALAYAALGWPVLPVGSDKRPLAGKGITHATTEETTIRRWWARWPAAGIGIHLEAAGLCAIDIDPRNGTEMKPADFPATLTARTGGGGWHLIYRAPEGTALPGKLAAGVDIKHKGYIVVEPSLHPSGNRYAWEDFDVIGAALVGAPAIGPFPVNMLKPDQAKASDLVEDDGDIAVSDQTIGELRAALASMQSDERDLWIRIGQALKRLGDQGHVLWLEWSQKSEKYDQEDAERVWQSLAGERTGYAAVFAEAQRGGWQNPRSAAPTQTDVLADFKALPEAASGRFEGQNLATFAAGKPAPQIVQGWLPQAELAVIVGETGSGKSFFAFDLAAAIARGALWRGQHKTKALRVACVIAEGTAGARIRVAAYAEHHGIALNDLDIIAFPHSPNLMTREDTRDLIAAIQKHAPVGVVVIDTLAQVTPGSNESASEDMGKALAHFKAIHRATGALILAIHHLGKDPSKGARGHSSLKAAANAEITISRNGSLRTATVTKMKDGADGQFMQFRLLVVPVGADEDGTPVDSCVLEHVHVQETASAREPAGKNTKLVWKVVNDLAGLGGRETSVPAVLTTAAEALVHDPSKVRDRRRDLAVQALQALKDMGWVAVENDRVLLRGRK